MKPIRWAIGAVAALAATSGMTQFGGDARKVCHKMCEAARAAFERKDIAWFEKNSTKDFTYTDATGTRQNKKQAIEGIQQMFAMSQNLKVKIKCGDRVTTSNGVIKHPNVMISTSTMMGEDKKMHTMQATVYTEDYLKKENGVWKFYKVVEVKPMTLLMDGKPMPAGGG